ncbi:hypothetical protein BgiBS90_010758 [Biomphalaria glabrata]|nr:hypothetical protein BgiBS90_010758 [Biomphalaria glabrata]
MSRTMDSNEASRNDHRGQPPFQRGIRPVQSLAPFSVQALKPGHDGSLHTRNGRRKQNGRGRKLDGLATPDTQTYTFILMCICLNNSIKTTTEHVTLLSASGFLLMFPL